MHVEIILVATWGTFSKGTKAEMGNHLVLWSDQQRGGGDGRVGRQGGGGAGRDAGVGGERGSAGTPVSSWVPGWVEAHFLQLGVSLACGGMIGSSILDTFT